MDSKTFMSKEIKNMQNLKEFKNKYFLQTPINKRIDHKIHGWGSESIAILTALQKSNPESIVEVGTWLGAGSIFMAENSNAEILAVDTFLASNEILWREEFIQKYIDKNLISNFSGIFDQFCANITYKNFNSRIGPLPMTSSSAAEFLTAENVKIDMVYIDAGHRDREVYADIEDWWPLTNKVLLGDDYNPERWPGVVSAANRFAEENNINLEVLDYKFFLWK
jgi:hypothetical protein